MAKLIRDRIPEIALAKEGVPMATHIADDAEYSAALVAKLQEEVDELLAAPSDLGEFADVLEVLHAIAAERGLPVSDIAELSGAIDMLHALGEEHSISPSDMEAARIAKREKRGGFERRIIWEG
jgi:predicted house-cleaning noncanonical NTP pyrophosphatase (MazG superfamily)